MHNGVKKVCLVGPSIGKTTYACRLKDPEYKVRAEYIPTIGVEVMNIPIDDTEISLWDLAGQELYMGLRDAYLLSADAVLVAAKSMEEYEEVSKMYATWLYRLGNERCPIKPLILSPDHVNINDRESCLKPMREILA